MEALYNKYRPQIFEDVVGQEHIERTIKNALASNKISHAYMFTGPRGTGKTTTARLLSKALLCENGPTADPDGTCEDCELIASGEHPDVYELDAASRTGVENVREEIIGKVDYAPTRGKYKVYIIDEIHMLSTAAFNALLKTLEEPPDHVIFIMCTTDPQKVPETILSRCQRFDFRRISSEEMVSRLGAICEMENITFEGDALDLIAHRAQGGMRDALTSLEQLIAFGNGEVTMDVAERLLGSLDSSDLADIVKAIGTRNVAECFNWTASYMETGADLVQFVGDLTQHVRDMYVMSLAGADVSLDVTEAGRRELEVELSWYGPDRLARMLDVLGDLTRELKTSTNQRLSFEIALTRMVRPESDITLSSLSERIESLERSLRDDASIQAATPQIAAPVQAESSASAENVAAKPVASAEVAAAADSEPDEPAPAPSAKSQSDKTAEASSSQKEEVEQPSTPSAAVQEGNLNAPQVWNTTMAHLKKIGPAYGVVFMNTNVRMDGNVFVIEFSKNNDFAFKASQKQDARDALDKALERAGYAGLKYQIIQSKEEVSTSNETTSVVSVAETISADPVHETPIAEVHQEVPAAEAAKAANPEPTAELQQGFDDAAPEPEAIPDASEYDFASPDDVPPWEDLPVEGAPVAQAALAPEPNGSDEAAAADDSAPSASESSEEEGSDLQDLLTSAFGDGVVFEEVKE